MVYRTDIISPLRVGKDALITNLKQSGVTVYDRDDAEKVVYAALEVYPILKNMGTLAIHVLARNITQALLNDSSHMTFDELLEEIGKSVDNTGS